MPRVTNKTQVQLGVLIQSSLRFCLRLGSLIVDDHPLGARVGHGLHGSGGSTDRRLGHGGRFWGQQMKCSKGLSRWYIMQASMKRCLKPMKTYMKTMAPLSPWPWLESGRLPIKCMHQTFVAQLLRDATGSSRDSHLRFSDSASIPHLILGCLSDEPFIICEGHLAQKKKKGAPATDWTVRTWLWTRIYH